MNPIDLGASRSVRIGPRDSFGKSRIGRLGLRENSTGNEKKGIGQGFQSDRIGQSDPVAQNGLRWAHQKDRPVRLCLLGPIGNASNGLIRKCIDCFGPMKNWKNKRIG